MSYQEKLESLSILENTWQTALNQTTMHRLIRQHFLAPLPEGKETKKAIVIGYDGCTCEMLHYLDREQSGIHYLLENGGHGVFSYAGGAPYPQPITQETSTAPSWCSMLTGELAEHTKIVDNGITKAVEPKTLLLTLVEEKLAKSSAFYVSWEGHFAEDGATYLDEKQYAEEHHLSTVFACAADDEGTRENVLNDISAADGSDFIFCILEYTDHTGHGVDYLPEKPEYLQAFHDAETTGIQIINAIQNRASYNTEDWLILITSDHGGYHCGHGGPTLQERITFIISNKDIL